MSKIKIYLQRPWKNSDSPYYLYLREQPPENVNYVNANEFKLIENKRKFKINNFVKKNVKNLLKLASGLPNAHRTKENGFDIIHCAHCLSLNKKPWVADIELYQQLWASQNAGKKLKIKKLLESEHCKKIMPWTEWCKKGVLKQFPEIENKTEVVYPAVPGRKFKKSESKEEINLLFSARDFFLKGGKDATETIDKLTKKHKNVNGTIVSDIPKEILNKYSGNKKITFHRLMPQEKLYELYKKADVFVYPTKVDCFGFGILEAFSFGLPIVSCEGQARRELIEDGKTGYVISQERLTGVVEKLINDEKLRKKTSKNCLKEIKDGKFSIKQRNKKLKRIYEEALK